MIILASDTSTSAGSVALRGRDGKVVRENLDGSRPHSETLLPTVEKILDRAGLGRKDVQAIAVGTGPGAFTGLRVGLATFKAWASASGLPMVPVVSMDAVAWPVLKDGHSSIVLADARKDEVYAAYYPSLDDDSLPGRRGDVILIPHSEVMDWVLSLEDHDAHFAGTALPLLASKGLAFGGETAAGPGEPDAVCILGLAEILIDLGRSVDPSALVPGYVRRPDAKKPSPGTIVTEIPGSGGYPDS
jgi:tRNA threonylcarbamoyladenosine biosynthesis protein TsaB